MEALASSLTCHPSSCLVDLDLRKGKEGRFAPWKNWAEVKTRFRPSGQIVVSSEAAFHRVRVEISGHKNSCHVMMSSWRKEGSSERERGSFIPPGQLVVKFRLSLGTMQSSMDLHLAAQICICSTVICGYTVTHF